MNYKNLNKTKKLFLIVSIIALFYQLTIYNTVNDLFVILIIFFSNIFTTSYCLNNKNFFKYPISLLMIFFSYFLNLGNALYFKSFEFSLITENLEMPLYTVINLAIFNLLIISSHYFYIMNNLTINMKNSLNLVLIKMELFDIKNINLLYLISFIALAGRIFYADYTQIADNQYSAITGPGLLKDFINGLGFCYIIPIIIYFADDLIKINKIKKNYVLFAFFLILIIFISFTKNSRATLFDPFLLAFILIFLRFLFGKIKTESKSFFYFFLILIMVFFSFNVVENISKNFTQQKDIKGNLTPLENVKALFNNIISNKDFSNYESSSDQSENLNFFAENYYKATTFNRMNFLLIHDNFSYIKKSLSETQVANLRDLQKNKLIAILPQPIINFFFDNFNKEDYIRITTASYLYGRVNFEFDKFSIGSGLFSVFIMFGNWTYLILLFLFIPSFIFFDSFYDYKRQYFSPYIFIFFYSTSSGILNFIASKDVYVWLELPLRTIPQTVLFILIIKFFSDKFYSSR